MKNKILGLTLMVVMLLGLMACTDKEKGNMNAIPFEKIDFGGDFIGLNGDEQSSAITRSKQELTDFFKDYNIINWTNDTPIWERYNDEYFDDKALILFFSWVTGSNIERYVDEVYVDNTFLTLKIIGRYEGDAINNDEGFLPIIVEVNKDKVINVLNIEVDIKYENLFVN